MQVIQDRTRGHTAGFGKAPENLSGGTGLGNTAIQIGTDSKAAMHAAETCIRRNPCSIENTQQMRRLSQHDGQLLCVGMAIFMSVKAIDGDWPDPRPVCTRGRDPVSDAPGIGNSLPRQDVTSHGLIGTGPCGADCLHGVLPVTTGDADPYSITQHTCKRIGEHAYILISGKHDHLRSAFEFFEQGGVEGSRIISRFDLRCDLPACRSTADKRTLRPVGLGIKRLDRDPVLVFALKALKRPAFQRGDGDIFPVIERWRCHGLSHRCAECLIHSR